MGEAKAIGGLGFIDFESFNKTMLAKHCWRFLTNQNSLATIIFQEKYFRKETLLKA